MITNQSNQTGRAQRSGTPARHAATGSAVTGAATADGRTTGRAPRRRERVATVTLMVGLGAALAAVTLSGCGIRSTAVPVDAGLPASRTACPPSPQASASSSPFSGGPAALPSPGTGNALSGVPSPLVSESPWEALTSTLASTLTGPATSAAPGATSRSAASSPSGSARAQHGSAAPSPHVSASERAATTTTPAPARSAKSGFSTASCGGPATGAP